MVDLKLAWMEKDFRVFLQNQGKEYACGDAGRKDLIGAGWTVRFYYQFQGGAAVVVEASCEVDRPRLALGIIPADCRERRVAGRYAGVRATIADRFGGRQIIRCATGSPP